MYKLEFKQVEHANSVYPYLLVYLLEENQSMEDIELFPFLRIFVEADNKLYFEIYPATQPVYLTEAHWEGILLKAREFLKALLANDNRNHNR
ncbi:hypothetical protein [Paraburkholderia hayleyella]|uniref:hypothetical protein n=1 Tax=Paraburkholderia hayleyella TaxID=2152889 RepID=UPI001292630B|nr:hypothetical protein [Paraburkholderia hayleyella]